MVKVGIVGVGHLGQIHCKCITQTQLQLAGVFDINEEQANTVAKQFKCEPYNSYDDLLTNVDAVIIAAPTTAHALLAQTAIQAGKHVFIEKPVCTTIEEANRLLDAAKDCGLVVQVGHVERFNPAFMAIESLAVQPKFIEGHRLATFNPRGNDVSVVLDLMIHDIDLVLALIKSPIREIMAHGVGVVHSTADICNARLHFENGSVANLTASRISMKQMRKLRIFQPNKYISVDLLLKKTESISLSEYTTSDHEDVMTIETDQGKKVLALDQISIEDHNAIVKEHQDFYNSIVGHEPVKVDLRAGVNALEIAFKIESFISKREVS